MRGPALAVLVAVLFAAPAHAAGPKLDATPADRAKSLDCTADVRAAPRDPVLLIPGTTLTPQEFEWNYKPALTARGVPWCAVEPPGNMMRDIQSSAEFVVGAIRAMHRRSSRKVDIIGHSQGGMIGRWALKFWPDTRRKVDDLIGLAPSNHGSQTAPAICHTGCAAAIWQQRTDSAFIKALNAGRETFKRVDYTSVYTANDGVVTPNYGDNPSSALRTGPGDRTNVRLQDLCPASTSDHVSIGTFDPVGWALAVDALDHRGPADPARIDRGLCSEPFMPGVRPDTFPLDLAATTAILIDGLSKGKQIPAEPALRPYAAGRRVPR